MTYIQSSFATVKAALYYTMIRQCSYLYRRMCS